MASRNENYHNLLKKNYKKNNINRYFCLVSIANQHFGMNINKKLIKRLNKYIFKISPDLVFNHRKSFKL